MAKRLPSALTRSSSSAGPTIRGTTARRNGAVGILRLHFEVAADLKLPGIVFIVLPAKEILVDGKVREQPAQPEEEKK